MSDYKKIANERQAHNLGEFFEHGPGLRKTTQTFFLAKCITGRHALMGGLGGMGVGQMWTWAREHGKSDGEMRAELVELWDQLPIESCCNFGINDACSPGSENDLVFRNVINEQKVMKKL